MEILKLNPPSFTVQEAEIQLESSKSISNRVLVIQALCDDLFEINRLSEAQDTFQLSKILYNASEEEIYTGDGGTTYRFLLAYLALQERECILTASKSMNKRPIGPLVDALRQIGARIEYLEKKGHPPISLKGGKLKGGSIELKADVSSQFVSALMMIAPYLKEGLDLHLSGTITSQPYLEMTAHLMQTFGARIKLDLPQISIKYGPYNYSKEDYTVEADWSGASYFWAHSCLLPLRKIKLKGLFEHSIQGDSILVEWAKKQGFRSSFMDDGLMLEKGNEITTNWCHQLDLRDQPDLAQTVLSLYAVQGSEIEITGLQSLFHKETNRLHALQQELGKTSCRLAYTQKGVTQLKCLQEQIVQDLVFDTYHDHRMAMALSLFANQQCVQIKDPEVINKSFPGFWSELEQLGFGIEGINNGRN